MGGQGQGELKGLTRLTWTVMKSSRGTREVWNWRKASTKGIPSMSPMVPPSSMMQMSGSRPLPSTHTAATRSVQFYQPRPTLPLIDKGQRAAHLDGIRDVGDDLDRLAQVLTRPFRVDHLTVSDPYRIEPCSLKGTDLLIDLAGGDVVVAGEAEAHVALVVAEVQVHLPAVREHEDLAVLVRRETAGVDVEVGVDLDGGDAPSVEL